MTIVDSHEGLFCSGMDVVGDLLFWNKKFVRNFTWISFIYMVCIFILICTFVFGDGVWSVRWVLEIACVCVTFFELTFVFVIKGLCATSF